MRVLLVEDDPLLANAMSCGMRLAGWAVDWAQDGAAGELALRHETYDAALLDLGVPRRSGMELLRALRHDSNPLPVVLVSGRDSAAERIAGLDGGADDYLVKPFDLRELLARMRAVVRRACGRGQPIIVYGAIALDPTERTVHVDGRPVALTQREFALLEVLLKVPGAVVSARRLEDALYGWGEEVCSNSVQVHIHNLRSKLGRASIRCVRRMGYRVSFVDNPLEGEDRRFA